MAAAKKLVFNVYPSDPDGGATVLLKKGTRRSDIPERFLPLLGDHVWGDDEGAIDPGAAAPPGGVTGQDPASRDRDGDGEPDGPSVVSGSVKQVLASVGGDKAKAQAALDAEQAAAKPRTSLVSKLQVIAGGAGS